MTWRRTERKERKKWQSDTSCSGSKNKGEAQWTFTVRFQKVFFCHKVCQPCFNLRKISSYKSDTRRKVNLKSHQLEHLLVQQIWRLADRRKLIVKWKINFHELVAKKSGASWLPAKQSSKLFNWWNYFSFLF